MKELLLFFLSVLVPWCFTLIDKPGERQRDRASAVGMLKETRSQRDRSKSIGTCLKIYS